MAKTLLLSGLGLTMVGFASYLHDCQASFVGGACVSTTIADELRSIDLYAGQGDGGSLIAPLMSMPFAQTAFVVGVAACIAGGIGFINSL
jgi:hypothetical protein